MDADESSTPAVLLSLEPQRPLQAIDSRHTRKKAGRL